MSKTLWAIGAITALMTSFYMFRLLFMTFFGTRREHALIDANQEPTGAVHAPSAADAQAGHTHDPETHPAHAIAASAAPFDDHGHGHGHGVHESPALMLGPLVALAILALIGGWIGVPHALGGANRFEAFLAPVFEHYAPANAAANRGQSVPAEAGAPGNTASAAETRPGLAGNAAAEREGAGPDTSDVNLERGLTAVSLLLALCGAGLAWFFYGADPARADRAAAKMRGLHRLLWHKYWIDELYGFLFINPIMKGSREVLWKDIDVHVIDGTVNGAGHAASGIGSITRRMQSGNIRAYAAWVALGAACVIAFMIYMGASR